MATTFPLIIRRSRFKACQDGCMTLMRQCQAPRSYLGCVRRLPIYIPKPTASMWEMINDGRKSFRKSEERKPPFFMTLVFLMLREVERLGCFSRNSFGGLFSGRLDQSQIQSAFFFIRFSTSRILSWKSSSDCELFPSEPFHKRSGVCALRGLLH